MKNFVLYLPGPYRTEHIDFYRKMSKGKVRVAVDGGFSFFRRTHTFPDLLIGDFDSLRRKPSGLPARTKVISFPVAKDKTDLQLALEYCLNHRARSIDIVSPQVGEIDHFLGNIMLMKLLSPKGLDRRIDVRIISHQYEIRLLVDDRVGFAGGVGDIVSVLPMSPAIVLTCSGMAYAARNLRLKSGESRALRNEIKAKRASVTVKGEALVIRQFRPCARPK
jgi:thiamine pyrophosphokinase